MHWDVLPIDAHHDVSAFDCGEARLNAFLQRHALVNDASGVGKTFVAVVPGSTVVVGFVTLAMASVSFDVLPDAFRKGLPKYPIPSVHIGRLAVSGSSQGRGLGAILLMEAFARAARAGESVGTHVIDVFAKHDGAKAFYLRHGFTELKDEPLHLFLPIETARQVLRVAEGKPPLR